MLENDILRLEHLLHKRPFVRATGGTGSVQFTRGRRNEFRGSILRRLLLSLFGAGLLQIVRVRAPQLPALASFVPERIKALTAGISVEGSSKVGSLEHWIVPGRRGTLGPCRNE